MSKIVLVTGASSGIGQSISRTLCQQGHTVYGASRHVVNGAKIHGVIQLQMDVTSEEAVRDGIQEIISRSGKLDVVVNCAGVNLIESLEDSTEFDTRLIFETQVFGAIRVCRFSSRFQREMGGGYIVNIVSKYHKIGMPFRSVYAAANGALASFSRSLHLEMKAYQVHVVVLELGDFRTNLFERRIQSTHEKQSDFEDGLEQVTENHSQKIRRAMSPEAVGHLVGAIILNPKPALYHRTHKVSYWMGQLIQLLLPESLYHRYVLWSNKLPSQVKKKSDD